jgi:hypothetical protein
MAQLFYGLDVTAVVAHVHGVAPGPHEQVENLGKLPKLVNPYCCHLKAHSKEREWNNGCGAIDVGMSPVHCVACLADEDSE